MHRRANYFFLQAPLQSFLSALQAFLHSFLLSFLHSLCAFLHSFLASLQAALHSFLASLQAALHSFLASLQAALASLQRSFALTSHCCLLSLHLEAQVCALAKAVAIIATTKVNNIFFIIVVCFKLLVVLCSKINQYVQRRKSIVEGKKSDSNFSFSQFDCKLSTLSSNPKHVE